MEGRPAHGLIAQTFVEAPKALFEQAAGAPALMPMTGMLFGRIYLATHARGVARSMSAAQSTPVGNAP